MAYPNLNQPKGGFIVNTSAVAAKSIDVSANGLAVREALLQAALNEERAKTACENAKKSAIAADKALLESLSNGSYFGKLGAMANASGYSYVRSYARGYGYSYGSSYGNFINSNPGAADLARYGLSTTTTVDQPLISPINRDSAPVQAPQVTTEAPASESVDSLGKIKAFLLKHKLFVLVAVLTAIVVVFRKK